MLKVIGKTISKGEYNGKSYHKIVLHCQQLSVNSKLSPEGVITEVVRLSYDEKNSQIRIGEHITVLYDKYGHPEYVRKEKA